MTACTPLYRPLECTADADTLQSPDAARARVARRRGYAALGEDAPTERPLRAVAHIALASDPANVVELDAANVAHAKRLGDGFRRMRAGQSLVVTLYVVTLSGRLVRVRESVEPADPAA